MATLPSLLQARRRTLRALEDQAGFSILYHLALHLDDRCQDTHRMGHRGNSIRIRTGSNIAAAHHLAGALLCLRRCRDRPLWRHSILVPVASRPTS